MNIQALTAKTKPIADRVIKDAVMLGNWEIVNDKRASEITHRDNDDEPLHGLLFKAYEMKWNEVNTNGEMYDQAAFDDFIENYFVGRKFNMPVTVEHSNDPQWVVGRVLYIERNSVGFYFVGGKPTEDGFNELGEALQKKILLYMSYMPIFEEIEVNGKKFFLSHTVPSKERMQDFQKLLWQEFIIGEPEYEKEYFPDKFIVTGHTPTGFIDLKSKGKIWRENNHIAIDCGAVFGNPIGCICLDNFEEYYVE